VKNSRRRHLKIYASLNRLWTNGICLFTSRSTQLKSFILWLFFCRSSLWRFLILQGYFDVKQTLPRADRNLQTKVQIFWFHRALFCRELSREVSILSEYLHREKITQRLASTRYNCKFRWRSCVVDSFCFGAAPAADH